MKTYNTYAEAKIANPKLDIFKLPHSSIYAFFAADAERVCQHNLEYKCNPAEYCSTVEEFLYAGYKLFSGDIIIAIDGRCLTIGSTGVVGNPMVWDIDDCDSNRYILQSAALNGGSKIPEDRCEQDEESDAHVLRRIADKLDNQEAAKKAIDQSSASVKESPLSFDEVMTESGVNEWNGEGFPPDGDVCEVNWPKHS